MVDLRFTDVEPRRVPLPAVTGEPLIGTRLLDLLPDIAANGMFDWFVETVDTR